MCKNLKVDRVYHRGFNLTKADGGPDQDAFGGPSGHKLGTLKNVIYPTISH